MQSINNNVSFDKKTFDNFAEVLQSNIASFQAQSWQWDIIPEFGSLVCATSNNRTTFAIIYNISTGPTDPIRQPIPYKKTEAELRFEQPQIFEFLTTNFSCLAIGYQEDGHFFYNVPPQPIKMHTFVRYATSEEYKLCFASHHFLHLIYKAQDAINHDELILAIIKHQLYHKTLSKEGFNSLIETLFMLNKNNYLHTKMFLQRVQHIVKNNPLYSGEL